MRPDALPGADFVSRGLGNLSRGNETVESLLVSLTAHGRQRPAAPDGELPTCGGMREMADRERISRGLITDAEMRRQHALLEPQLYRFPAIDPPRFRRAVDTVFPP